MTKKLKKNKPIQSKEVRKAMNSFKHDDDDDVSSEVRKSKKKAGDKISAEFSESLSNVSEFDTQFNSNLQLMKNLRVLLLECLKVCHGAYRAKPTQGNSYALTNMVSQIKDITDRLEEAVDYEEVVTQLFDEEMKPFIEKLILSLGTIISNELDLQPNRKLMKKAVNNIYRKFGNEIESKLPKLKDSVINNILHQVK
jgi:PHP family Zn ribbon phosphoesterase